MLVFFLGPLSFLAAPSLVHSIPRGQLRFSLGKKSDEEDTPFDLPLSLSVSFIDDAAAAASTL